MKFFDYLLRRTSKDEVRDIEQTKQQEQQAGGKLFKIVNTVCILSIFVALGLVVLGACQLLDFTPSTFGIIGTIAALCVGCWLMLPWVACFEQKKNTKLALVFICLDIVVPLLWIMAIWILIVNVTHNNAGIKTLNFILAVFVISMQFAVASVIANTHLRYGKKLLVIQFIAYISFIYFDFYISYAVCCIRLTESEGLTFSGAWEVLGNKVMLALFILSVLYVAIAFSIINGGRKRRRRLGDSAREMIQADPVAQPVYEEQKKDTLEEQLQQLQNLRDKGLITQEEYEEKRKALIARW